MSQRSSVSPLVPTTIFFSTLTPEAPDPLEVWANAKPLSDCPSPAAPPIPRSVLRFIDGWLYIGELYNGRYGDNPLLAPSWLRDDANASQREMTVKPEIAPRQST